MHKIQSKVDNEQKRFDSIELLLIHQYQMMFYHLASTRNRRCLGKLQLFAQEIKQNIRKLKVIPNRKQSKTINANDHK